MLCITKGHPLVLPNSSNAHHSVTGKKKLRQLELPEVARMVKRAKEIPLRLRHSPVPKARCARNTTERTPSSLAV